MSVETVTRLLGVRYPIIQAPMVGVSTPALAAAVSEAGALGSLGLGGSSVEQARGLIAQTRALTALPFNVNLFCHAPNGIDAARDAAWIAHWAPHFERLGAPVPARLNPLYQSFLTNEPMLEMLLAEQPAVVSFHFGVPPTGWIKALKARGIVTLGCATTLAEARAVEQGGIDAVVAQGIEAGGHRGVFDPAQDDQLGLQTLLRQLAGEVRAPVIAAGGIMDAAGIQAALAAGASAVQMGTAFLLCPEASTSAAHRAALGSPQAYHTRITTCVSGRPARGLPNALYLEQQADPYPQPAPFPLAYDLSKQLNALASPSTAYAAQWAGQGAPLAQALPARALIQRWAAALPPNA
ncbi:MULTISPECIES: nitronate monooxygenase family protein [unclassified Pseudomonas]|uniref:NAD(P)H-dependent flavin oxidoreductase n=1 Tax=unclassified Pseudomonas TaxID=196821 RepID=UPI000BD14032|nr:MULTISPECIES: nitronate monooxygenase [unclassified Pseudomonas]PVZ20504.1 nitronate monooxygenase [Pseudomonas sp. URIL14HWK12:I12]PVZ27570.1 nitronate monooxygenase [Pseudomonas sp. URIL14HWK12:I10]PVZ38459.1 nitronate monooxygenase [Pseudomonas sp. URIL14HWK12:I11]SNZ03272.1 nitronate monooxygenase [Pseudomonas sp. URIL14HWK12:I9]